MGDDYYRGDLRGIVFNISGDMVGVRFLDGRSSSAMRLVTTEEGLLKIDPSGLPVPTRSPVEVDQIKSEIEEKARVMAEEMLPRELPAGDEDVVDAEVVDPVDDMTLEEIEQMIHCMAKISPNFSIVYAGMGGRPYAAQWIYMGDVTYQIPADLAIAMYLSDVRG